MLGPTDDDKKNESRKAWTIEKLMNGGDISTNTTSEEESISEAEKMFLYARAVHSNNSLQYHMHQMMERQRVLDEYRNMTMEGMDLIPLESNLYRNHPVIVSQIINMIETDNFWHHKTFESVMSNLRNRWTEGMQELENANVYCTNDDENNNEMDGIEVIDLCSASQGKNDAVSDRNESTKQESQDKPNHDELNEKVVDLRTLKDEPTIKKDVVESAMMCWEHTESLTEEGPHDAPEKVSNIHVETTEKQKHEEEHVGPTLDTGNRLKISIDEFSWEKVDDGSTLETEEHKQPQLVYITNLENDLRKVGTAVYEEEDPYKKSLLRRTGLLKCPPQVILITFLILMEKLVVILRILKISSRERTKRTRKNMTTLLWT